MTISSFGICCFLGRIYKHAMLFVLYRFMQNLSHAFKEVHLTYIHYMDWESCLMFSISIFPFKFNMITKLSLKNLITERHLHVWVLYTVELTCWTSQNARSVCDDTPIFRKYIWINISCFRRLVSCIKRIKLNFKVY
jgi:hypothetical protein